MNRTTENKERDKRLANVLNAAIPAGYQQPPLAKRACRICGYDRAHKRTCAFCGATPR